MCYDVIGLGCGCSLTSFMSPNKFPSRVELLRELNSPVVSLGEAVVCGLQSAVLPDCATVITIDDGWYGTFL
jgi:hypothetical protein